MAASRKKARTKAVKYHTPPALAKKKAGKRAAAVPKPTAAIRRRAATVLDVLRRSYPNATCALDWSDPLELLVATILSAQTTDKTVNKVTKRLFRKYRTPDDYASADLERFREDIAGIGLWRNKSANIIAACAMIRDDYGRRVPDTMDDLLRLPGVARKTANVVLGTAYRRNEGVVVDTHVQRIAQRLKLTDRKNNQGDKIEKALMAVVPRESWTFFGHAMIAHGRGVCTARKPDCDGCPINDVCPSAFKVEPPAR